MKGREIFEGDILEFQDEGVRDVIVWSGEWQYHTKNNFNNTQAEMSDGIVIGSIYKNPDLLEYTNTLS